MGKKGKNTAKKKAARQEAKATEKSDRELRRDLPAKLDALLAKGQEETKDIDLFADPPPKEECPICLHPFSLDLICGFSSYVLHPCCGKVICRGCIHASKLATDKINARKKANKEPLLRHTCAFCREPRNAGAKEDVAWLFKRAALNDGKSIDALAHMHRCGDGTEKDEAKALDLYCRAAELGEARAYHGISVFYHKGIMTVGKDERQAFASAEIAAKKGDIKARHILGFLENRRGNHTLAILHFKIAAEAGFQGSLDKLKEYLKLNIGLLEDCEFAEILRKCLASQAEMKTDQRDAWVKYVAATVRRG